MNVIVTDRGFRDDDWTAPVEPLDAASITSLGIDVPSETDPETLEPHLAHAALIRIAFPRHADGRGFTIARRLRRMGYAGRLRAAGHVLADQYAMARRSGFDEVEIDEAVVLRQPEAQWHARADWRAHDYQSRLRG